MSEALLDKVVIVAGGGSGIGEATAHLMAAEGAVVWCTDIGRLAAERVAQSIANAGHSAHPHELDVTCEADWDALFQRVLEECGGVQVLVNSAGISAGCPLDETSLDDWRRVLSVNLEGAFLGTKHAIRAMKKKGGSIVNVSSASGIKPAPGAAAYSVSKAGVCMLSKTAAKECLAHGYPIRVNTVCPGAVKTPLWHTMPFFQELVAQTGSQDAAFAKMAAAEPGSRLAEPEEIARAILYLASDQSDFVTGEDLVIDAGYTL